MSAGFLVDIIRPSRDVSYSHSIQYVLLIQRMFTMSPVLFSLHSLLCKIMSAEVHKTCNPPPFVTADPLFTGDA